jgi:hypothetical protein
MYFDDEKLEIIRDYLKKSFLKKLSFAGRGLNIAEAFIKGFNSTYINYERNHNKLVNTLWKSDTKHIQDIFSGRDFGALVLLLGEDNAENFKAIWDRCSLYTYPAGYLRRSYRTNQSTMVYLEGNIEKLKEAIYLSAIGFSLDKYFVDNKAKYEEIEVISDMISVELDKNNRTVIEKLREIIYGENNTAVVTRSIIKGMLKSRNEEAHKMIGELLLAAKLQEGLRQSIVESMDEGSREGFIYLLKLIIDNNLSRFSSIVRAFDTWTGLGISAEKPRVINKCLEAAFNCLRDKSYLEECISSNDNLLIYIGIWSVAFEEVEDITSVIQRLMWSKEKYKKLTALQFMYDTQFPRLSHEIVCGMPNETDFEVIALAVKNLFINLGVYSLRHIGSELEVYYELPDHCHGIKLFNQLKAVADAMPKKEVEYKGVVFPWSSFKLTTTEIIDKMILSVALSYNEEIVDTLISYKDKMSADTRQVFVEHFLRKPWNSEQRQALIEFCGDRSSFVREEAFKIIGALELNSEDYRIIEDLLKYKSGDLRKSAIKLLLRQEAEAVKESVQNLIESGNENKRLAAIEIVRAMASRRAFKKVYEECTAAVSALSNGFQKEERLASSILSENRVVRTFDNGFGLYDKDKEADIPAIKLELESNINSRFSMTASELRSILESFSNLIHENRDLEYEIVDWDDTKRTITLGGSYFLEGFTRDDYSLDNYPLAHKIRELSALHGLKGRKLIELNFYIQCLDSLRHTHISSWYRKLLEDNLNIKILKEFTKAGKEIPYYNLAEAYINLLAQEAPSEEKFEFGRLVSEELYNEIPLKKHNAECSDRNEDYYYYNNIKDFIAGRREVEYWLQLMEENSSKEESFKKYFNIAYNYYRSSGYHMHATLSLEHFGRALELGLIDENEIYKEFMTRHLSPDNIHEITSDNIEDYKKLLSYPRLIQIGRTVVDTIADIEVKRGELNTEVTQLASSIKKCHGTHLFIAIILGSEKDTYVRGYNFVDGDSTKKQMLSHLLKCCYPKEAENAASLKEALKGKKVTEKQLVEAAMYAPQWLDIVAEYLGYEGLKSACWYFHAHVNDYFSEEKEAIVARYTPIASQDLKDGAFDKKWFIEAYGILGEKKFKLVYDSAKYIAGGGLHKRSQLFADAALGKLKAEEVKERVKDKRSKDYLLSYGLIPIKDKEDLLERYEYIHQYLKESKQFGSQRQASEKRSVEITLLNLAVNAGYNDVNRLTWNMETAKLESIRSYLEGHKIEDIELKLIIDELGQADILCIKDGKTLKDIPAKLKKHEYVTELKAIKKSLRDQYTRARESFEASMVKGEEFSANELNNLCLNPVLSPIIKNLVFIAGDKHGYFKESSLVDFRGNAYKLSSEETLIIAHPVWMYETDCWSDYQKDIFFKKLVQPFKQVFRELYLPNADELREATISRRYAGYQVQPKKTLALLKARGWLASYEEGLQKVYYKEDIVVSLYAAADWFSPADIEAPVIEAIRFEDRKTSKSVEVNKVPKLVFSEAMRDIDLVVSTAHVGGVDPEASLSTIGIRTVIIEELLKLLKLSNVTIKCTHAYIKGVHGEYTVHLGSGVVHKMGIGAINIIAVHSGHRGRIFLPFIDSDPRSAEILSKIILLAEDSKIKDPNILAQL